jgi:glutamate dehydrogenase (NADP+)
VQYRDGEKPWDIKCDCAFPSATQNEISGDDAEKLVRNGCTLVSEGANMPTDPDGARVFLTNRILYGPGKAANAGGVAVSGLEMAQNSQHVSWPREEVDARLHQIMKAIHTQAASAAESYGDPQNYVMGANIAGFVKVADAMLDQGLV